jgi:hypothetical protein
VVGVNHARSNVIPDNVQNENETRTRMAMITDKTGVRYRWTNKSKILTDEKRIKHEWTKWKGEVTKEKL